MVRPDLFDAYSPETSSVYLCYSSYQDLGDTNTTYLPSKAIVVYFIF